jgi:hypothetical protein
MREAYSPQKHAAALSDWTQLLRHQAREIAALHGKVDRLLHTVAAPQATSVHPAFDRLVAAAFEEMGTSVWCCSDLLGRTLRSTPTALALLQAIEATNKTKSKSLGIYLCTNVPGHAHVTVDGLEIRRCGLDAKAWTWTIAGV